MEPNPIEPKQVSEAAESVSDTPGHFQAPLSEKNAVFRSGFVSDTLSGRARVVPAPYGATHGRFVTFTNRVYNHEVVALPIFGNRTLEALRNLQKF